MAGVVLYAPLPATAAVQPPAAHTDTAPVNLATPVDMANGRAHPSAIVRSGDARIEVLSPTLLRLEYSPTGRFENSPTVNAIDRRLPVPPYTTRVSGGWLTVQTSRATLRYKVDSGPFTALNTSLRFTDGDAVSTVHPTWDWECPFDQTCQSGAAHLSGEASLGQGTNGYDSSAGFVGYLFHPGDAATWDVLGAPAGPASVSLRYSNTADPLAAPGAHTLELVVNGQPVRTLVADQTAGADPWATLTTTVSLTAGSNAVEVACATGDSCNVELDTLSIGPASAPAPVPAATKPLGGWFRGFDTFTYNYLPGDLCAAGTSDATCQVAIEPLHTDGLLDEAGYRLLDDSQSALWTTQGWVEPRPANGDVEDGYLFVYGHDYAGALRTFAQLTGPAPLLPRNVFGVWYSDYTPYSSSEIEDSIYPAFQANQVPLNTLSLDTDWKAPNDWDGWEWNNALFPDPTSFLAWAHARGIDVTLNIHSSIDDHDPQLSTAEALAGNSLASSTCSAGPCKVWDWSTISQAESNFDLQQSLQKQGVAFWWLDWCCDESIVSMPGLTPDAWIGHLYAQEMVNQGQRGFVLARIGSSNDDPLEVFAAGPWSDHTSAIAFTGDAWGTWNTLAQEIALTPDEATIGEPYVSDDIGSYLGAPPLGVVPADLYDRWVQWGTFAPILRLHSADGDRLPWQYPEPERGITENFLRLREALLPYSYTLADQSHDDGLPMTRPLYLDYPGQSAAYDHGDEYLYGPDMLVAPVTTPGTVADTTVWIPPGRWVDYFTGATFTGPRTVTLAVPLDRMPVFVRAGGIIPEQSSSTKATTTSPTHLVLKVFSGSSGTFSLYGDSGSGLGYAKGQFTLTRITDATGTVGGGAGEARVTVGAATGHYRGQPTAVGYRLELVDLTQPARVTVDGRRLDRRSPGSDGAGWYYQSSTATVVVTTGSRPTAAAFTVVASGTRTVRRAEPSPASS
jgi:hypothetical protein